MSRPQLKRIALDRSVNVLLFVFGVLLLALAGTLLMLGTGQFLALEEHRLAKAPPVWWSTWFEQTSPKYFTPEVRRTVIGMRRLQVAAIGVFAVAVAVLWRAFN